MGRPLVVHTAELLRRAGTQRDLDLALGYEELELVDDRLTPEHPVSVVFHLESLTDGIVVTGSVGVAWQGYCRRCLQPVGGRAVAEIHELYQVTVVDPDAFPILGDQLDLGPMVREHALLILPNGPLCRPDCAGLCPRCGVDRNEQSCACVEEVRDDRWAALEQLRATLVEDEPSGEWSSEP